MRRVTVIIPVREVGSYLLESVTHVLTNYPDVEVIVVPDYPDASSSLPSGVRVVPSGPNATPGDKRDLAARLASGEVLAFLDDDAYPEKGWLESALAWFNDSSVAAVGGPGVTPPTDGVRQRASGWVLASYFGGGNSTYRFRPGRYREVNDFPSMNILVRKVDFEAVGGFRSQYWPGEDSEFCNKIVTELHKRIIYDPNALVYHHRRPLFSAHLRQQARYGIHRGYFARHFGGNSKSVSYAVPTLFTAGLLFGPLIASVFPLGMVAYRGALIIYGLCVAATASWVWYHERNLRVAALTAAGILATHVAYGIAYMKGLLSEELSH